MNESTCTFVTHINFNLNALFIIVPETIKDIYIFHLSIKSESGLRQVLWSSIGIKMFTDSIGPVVFWMITFQTLNKVGSSYTTQVWVLTIGFL